MARGVVNKGGTVDGTLLVCCEAMRSCSGYEFYLSSNSENNEKNTAHNNEDVDQYVQDVTWLPQFIPDILTYRNYWKMCSSNFLYTWCPIILIGIDLSWSTLRGTSQFRVLSSVWWPPKPKINKTEVKSRQKVHSKYNQVGCSFSAARENLSGIVSTFIQGFCQLNW